MRDCDAPDSDFSNLQNKLRVDTGAIKFVLQGANIMCPGLTSPGATIHTEARPCTQFRVRSPRCLQISNDAAGTR